MEKMIPNQSSININSQHFINHLETILIQLTQTLSIEHSVQPYPDGLKIARNMVQNKLNEMFNREEKEAIEKIKIETVDRIKSGDKYAGNIYELLKLFLLE